jgi:hypothetical protein
VAKEVILNNKEREDKAFYRTAIFFHYGAKRKSKPLKK